MSSQPTSALCSDGGGNGTAAGWHGRGGMEDGVMHGEADGR